MNASTDSLTFTAWTGLRFIRTRNPFPTILTGLLCLAVVLSLSALSAHANRPEVSFQETPHTESVDKKVKKRRGKEMKKVQKKCADALAVLDCCGDPVGAGCDPDNLPSSEDCAQAAEDEDKFCKVTGRGKKCQEALAVMVCCDDPSQPGCDPNDPPDQSDCQLVDCCDDPSGAGCDPDNPPSEKECAKFEDKIEKFCDESPGVKKEFKEPRDIFIDGKKRGKKITKTTTLSFDKPGQRYGHEKRTKWDNIVIKPPKEGDLKASTYRPKTNTKDKLQNKTFFEDTVEPINNDHDCVDTVTGKHVRGCDCFEDCDDCANPGACQRLKRTLSVKCTPDGGATTFSGDPSDGEEDDCFGADGTPKMDLLDGCWHEESETYLEGSAEDYINKNEETDDACYYYDKDLGTTVLRTSLVELIDEDGPSPDTDGNTATFDIDGDGLDGEDPPSHRHGDEGGGATDNPNDDHDCVDTFTGEHLRGCDCFKECDDCADPGECTELKRSLSVECTNEAGDPFSGDPSDGTDDGCFDADGNLKNGMTLLDGCKHVNGTYFEGSAADYLDGSTDTEDECYYYDIALEKRVLKTSLAELIDEDDGQAIDDDEDGLTDEDGPEIDFEEACKQAGRDAGIGEEFLDDLITADGGCDLTRVVIAKANKRYQEEMGVQPKCEQAQRTLKCCDDPSQEGCDPDNPPSEDDCAQAEEDERKFCKDNYYQVDNDDSTAVSVYGEEEDRRLVIEETYTAVCDDGMVYDDETDKCVPEEQIDALTAFRSTRAGLALSDSDSSTDAEVMMGFTFAPPRVRWGLFYKEELDLYFFSITLFEAKIGFDFQMGVGFRLPAEVTVTGLPGPEGLLAETVDTFETTIMPRNFSAGEYEAFCLKNGMGNTNYCKRFAFPNALVSDDGDEFALRLVVFAGIKVVIVEIPILNFGIDLDYDVPEMMSYYFALNEAKESPEAFAEALYNNQGDFGKAVTELELNCGTYTTPFGYDDDGNPRQFPFIANAPFINQMVRADCAEAFVRGETVTLPDGETYPICTGMILGVPGASIGLGLGADLEMRSNLITADVAVTGDGELNPSAPKKVEYRKSANECDPGESDSPCVETIGPITVDNYDDEDSEDHDYAHLELKNFTYCLNDFSIRLKGQIMFGGILTLFPDFDDFTIYRFTIPGLGCGIPIGQHAGTKGFDTKIFVENYGLTVDVEPTTDDPEFRVDDNTLKIKPGEFGEFTVAVNNIGSVQGDFDNFHYELSNWPDQNPGEPYTFEINLNTDFDCLNSSGDILRGDPYNGEIDDCFDADGNLRQGLTEQIDEDPEDPGNVPANDRDTDKDGLIDEDPPDDWQTDPSQIDFNGWEILKVAPHSPSASPSIPPEEPQEGESLILAVSPFQHFLTKPGIYPFRVFGDSKDAKTFGLFETDPKGNYRMGASDVAFIEVTVFYEVRVVVYPLAPSAKPGIAHLYTVEGTNLGNDPKGDSMSVAVDFVDFNQAGCTLTTLGKYDDCPYRAVPTVIQRAQWTTADDLADQYGPLGPGQYDTDTFTITVPPEWAGMQNTTYQFVVTVVSQEDPSLDEPATDTRTVEQTVIATKESMVRYIGLEIRELIGEIENANADGTRTGGLLPIISRPAQQKIDRALELVLAGEFSRASNTLASNAKIVEAFVHALDGFNGNGTKIPADLDSDWRARATAIIEDLRIAEACAVPSAGQ